MSEIMHSHHGNQGPDRDNVPHNPHPYWKRAHHDWRFWLGMSLMLAAITIYVLSDDLALLPHGPRLHPQSTPAGKYQADTN